MTASRTKRLKGAEEKSQFGVARRSIGGLLLLLRAIGLCVFSPWLLSGQVPPALEAKDILERQISFLGSIPKNVMITFSHEPADGKKDPTPWKVYQVAYSSNGFYATTKASRHDTNDYIAGKISAMVFSGRSNQVFWRISNNDVSTWELEGAGGAVDKLNGAITPEDATNPILRDSKMAWRFGARICSFGIPNVVPGSFRINGTNLVCRRLEKGDELTGYISLDEAGRILEMTVFWDAGMKSGVKSKLIYDDRPGELYPWFPDKMVALSIAGSEVKRMSDCVLIEYEELFESTADQMAGSQFHVGNKDVKKSVYRAGMMYRVGVLGKPFAAPEQLLADRDVSGNRLFADNNYKWIVIAIILVSSISLPLLRRMITNRKV